MLDRFSDVFMSKGVNIDETCDWHVGKLGADSRPYKVSIDSVMFSHIAFMVQTTLDSGPKPLEAKRKASTYGSP